MEARPGDGERGAWRVAQGKAALAQAIASVEGRFGTHVLAHGAGTERRTSERRIQTDSSLDTLTPRLAAGALLVLSDMRALRLAIPTFTVARVAWQQRFGRTSGWTSLVAERAIFDFAALGTDVRDGGIRGALLEKTG